MSRPRILIIVGAIALMAAAAYFLPSAAWVTTLAERARETGTLGVIVFLAGYVAATIAFLPGSILTLAAGFAYGPVWGLAIASPASVLGATCAFLLGRALLRDWAAKKVGGSVRARACAPPWNARDSSSYCCCVCLRSFRSTCSTTC